MANPEGPLPSNKSNLGEKVPHAGGSYVPPEVREQPHIEGKTVHDIAHLDAEEVIAHTPDAMPFTEQERARAREHTKQIKKERLAAKRKRNLKIIAGSAAVSAITGIGSYIFISNSSDDSERLLPETSTSASKNPGPTSQPETQPPIQEGIVISPLESDVQEGLEYPNVMSERSELTSPESVANSFNQFLSGAIDNVVRKGADADDLRPLVEQELHYLVASPDIPGMTELTGFITSVARETQDIQKKYLEQHPDEDQSFLPKFGIWTNYLDGEADNNGNVSTMTDDTYQVMAINGDVLAAISANGSSQQYDFAEATVTMPNGDERETYVLTSFDFSN